MKRLLLSYNKDYYWNTLGVLLQNAASPLLLVVVTRLNGIDASGVFSFAFSIAIIFWALAMWGGRTYQASDATGEFKQASYVLVRIILSVLVLCLAFIFALLNQYDVVKTSLIMALVLFKVIESIADALYGTLQINNKLYLAGKSLFYKAIFGIALFIVIDVATKDVTLSSLGLVFANVLVFYLYDIPKIRSLKRGIVFDKPRALFQESFVILTRCLPIFIVSFLAAFSLNIPRYFLDISYPDQIGFFGILAMPVTLVVLVMTFILQPNIVRLSEYIQQRNIQQFSRNVLKLMVMTCGIGVSVFLVSSIVGVQMLTFIFGVDFSQYYVTLLLMVAGAIVSAFIAIYINILTIMRKLTSQFFILLISTLLLVSVSMPIVEEYGINGGVMLFLLANVLQFILFTAVYAISLKGLNYAKKD